MDAMDLGEATQLTVQGVSVPTMMYGTAWKEDATEGLVRHALTAGFRAIDTANQRKHYHEVGVGAALDRWWAEGNRREDVFLQTKFTYRRGQDHRLPYDPNAAPAVQVHQSFASSLEHLRTDRIDSYLLHGPSSRAGWSDTDRTVWRAMEAIYDSGQARLLGVSNVSPAHLSALVEEATVAPAFVQNRCYAIAGWDEEIRTICRQNGIVYQGFSLLTANRRSWGHPTLRRIAERRGATPAQVLFRFARTQGILPLTGTTDPEHMRQDLDSVHLRVDADEIEIIRGLEQAP